VIVDDVAIGANVQEARYRAGITQAALALETRLDRTALSRIESGERAATATELARLAAALSVDPATLLRPRSHETMGRPQPRMLLRAGPLAGQDESQLSWFTDLCEAVTQALPPKELARTGSRLARLSKTDAAEIAAGRLRSDEGMSPAAPFINASEVACRRGLHVVGARLHSRSRVAGCIVLSEMGTGLMLVNTNHPPRRQRFTLAHELGHWTLHEGEITACETEVVRPGPRSRTEGQADVFAAALLMPRKGCRDFFEKREVNLSTLEEFEATFGVSRAAALSRLKALGLVSPTVARVLRQMTRPDSTAGGSPPRFRVVGTTLAGLLPEHPLLGQCTIVPDQEIVP